MSVINDRGIIFYTKKYNERSLLVKILSESHGVVIGYITNALSKYNSFKNQIGNYVSFNHVKKTDDSIGLLTTEVIYSNIEAFFTSKGGMILLESLTFFLDSFIKENLYEQKLYNLFKNIIFAIKNNAKDIILYYLDFILYLCEYLGININYDICCITHTNKDLCYISPKTGNAVCKTVGYKYRASLFKIPMCFTKYCTDSEDIRNALHIIFYFLHKFLLEQNLIYLEKNFLFLRDRVLSLLDKE